MLLLAFGLIYLSTTVIWPSELKVPAIIVALALIYLGLAGLLVKSNKSFKRYISNTLSAVWPF